MKQKQDMSEKNIATDTLNDDERLTISAAKARTFMDLHSVLMPMVGELINRLVLEGKSREEIQAAVKNAACGYSAFYLAFVHD
ncbi:hypothetical protein E0G79_17425 [Salmonella enterica]|nr:hypothetical protein [Salmonella enterica]EBA9761783.1 hypothetical protein [Salmonella enterica]EEB5697281.1 hypothetical protein [Salmonella enterica]EGX5144546.1 hypothetical protein [Salmonella enterica]